MLNSVAFNVVLYTFIAVVREYCNNKMELPTIIHLSLYSVSISRCIDGVECVDSKFKMLTDKSTKTYADGRLTPGIITSVQTILGGHCGAATTAISVIEDVFTTHSARGMHTPYNLLSSLSVMQKIDAAIGEH